MGDFAVVKPAANDVDTKMLVVSSESNVFFMRIPMFLLCNEDYMASSKKSIVRHKNTCWGSLTLILDISLWHN